MRYHLTWIRMAIIKESTNNDVGEFVEKKYNLVQPQWKTVWRFQIKMKIKLPYNLTILPLSMYQERTKRYIYPNSKDTYTPTFITASLTIAKIWKQPKCPSTDDWFKKMSYTHTNACMCTRLHSGISLISQ